MSEVETKQEVRQFYDQIGWQMVSDGTYQNARYEDLRPVSREYIHRCHMRVKEHLKPQGQYLLDAGSGPIQYPEYLTYSEDYNYRVCADLSIVAMQEARKRIGDKGLFVVADVANLPFKNSAFDGVVSMHTIHHVPGEDKKKAYLEIYRVLKEKSTAVVVNGWTTSEFMRRWHWLVRLNERVGIWIARQRGKEPKPVKKAQNTASTSENEQKPVGTFITKLSADWIRSEIAPEMKVDIRVWRSVSVRFLRAVVHRPTGGKYLLRFLYWLEETFPHYFGEKGQYPLIVIYK
jgi:ubiquinone/menaquinone biosynthesis C-methylase UbiE